MGVTVDGDAIDVMASNAAAEHRTSEAPVIEDSPSEDGDSAETVSSEADLEES